MGCSDRELKCVACGETFIFPAAEQEFYLLKGYVNDPKHCRRCRSIGRVAKPRVETPIKCSECGTETTVPFKPSQNRPVLCIRCYQKKKRGTQSQTIPYVK